MSTGSSKPVSELRVRWKGSDQQALQALMPLVYGELRRVAHRYLQAEKRPNHPLRSTELVHEAYLRLVDRQPAELQNRAHFFAVSARLTREIRLIMLAAGAQFNAADVLLRWTTR